MPVATSFTSVHAVARRFLKLQAAVVPVATSFTSVHAVARCFLKLQAAVAQIVEQ